jgi:predicted nucleotidyltransferase
MDISTNEIVILSLSTPAITDFCSRWKITELALFGSALRPEFRETSDVDLLVTFTDDAKWSLLDHVSMEQELEKILGRAVDLVSRRAVAEAANHLRRDEILSSARAVYSAPETTHESR